jgi:hypothetical protein
MHTPYLNLTLLAGSYDLLHTGFLSRLLGTAETHAGANKQGGIISKFKDGIN